MKIWLVSLLLLVFLARPVFSHPGNTASDGCHYCRTNCDYWGVPWYQRHCHGGDIAPIVPQTDYTFPLMSATWNWWPNNDETFDISVVLDDSKPSKYSVELSKCNGCNPGPLIDFYENDFYFYSIKPGRWYLNVKKEIGGYWSTIATWTIDVPEWYPPSATPYPTSIVKSDENSSWIFWALIAIVGYMIYAVVVYLVEKKRNRYKQPL